MSVDCLLLSGFSNRINPCLGILVAWLSVVMFSVLLVSTLSQHTSPCICVFWMLLSNQISELEQHKVECVEVIMGYDSRLLRVTSNKTEQHSPFSSCCSVWGMQLLCGRDCKGTCYLLLHAGSDPVYTGYW